MYVFTTYAPLSCNDVVGQSSSILFKDLVYDTNINKITKCLTMKDTMKQNKAPKAQ